MEPTGVFQKYLLTTITAMDQEPKKDIDNIT
jgi:hypothetical protein